MMKAIFLIAPILITANFLVADDLDVVEAAQPSLRALLDKEFKEGLDLSKRLSERFPNSPLALSILARAYFLNEEFELSVDFFERAITKGGKFENLVNEYLSALLEIGDEEKVFQLKDSLLEIENKPPIVIATLSAIFADTNDRKGFQELLRSLENNQLLNPDVAKTIAKASMQLARDNSWRETERGSDRGHR